MALVPGTRVSRQAALTVPVTGTSLRRHRRRSVAACFAGVLLLLGAEWAPRWYDPVTAPGTTVLVCGPSLALLALGCAELVRATRMERCLTVHPWRSYRAVLDMTPEVFAIGRPVLVLTDADGRTHAHSVTGWTWHPLLGATGEVWIAGDPRRACVVSPPGGDGLLWLRPLGTVTRFRLGIRPRNDQQGVS